MIVFVVGFFLEIYSLPALALAVVAMLVGAIPEGLPAITSVILAFGISKMAKEHQTIIKSIPAVETLGSVDVIATDKTGTLTEGVFHVSKINSKVDETEFFKVASIAEMYSNHPIAKSIVKRHKISPELWRKVVDKMSHKW